MFRCAPVIKIAKTFLEVAYRYKFHERDFTQIEQHDFSSISSYDIIKYVIDTFQPPLRGRIICLIHMASSCTMTAAAVALM